MHAWHAVGFPESGGHLIDKETDGIPSQKFPVTTCPENPDYMNSRVRALDARTVGGNWN
jgi:hypothetical protein